MATIVNNPSGGERVIERDDSAGWAIAVIILLAVIVIGGIVWARYRGVGAEQQGSTANINVTIPDTGLGDGSNSGDTSGGNSGGASY